MPDDQKDKLGDTLHKKQKADEDKYFAELSRKQVEKLRQVHATSAAAGTADCPRCGAPLEVRKHRDIALEACTKECGIWLDKRELEEITRREGTDTWLSRLLLGKHS